MIGGRDACKPAACDPHQRRRANQNGNHVIPAVLAAVEVADETSGATSVVRLRSAGTPTIMVSGF
jgi:hypothetical protein